MSWVAGPLVAVVVMSQAASLPPGHPALEGAGPATSVSPHGAGLSAPKGELPPGHPHVGSGNAPPSAQELLRQLDGQPDLKSRDKTFEVAAALAKLYFSNARYLDSTEYFRQALEKAAPVRSYYLDQAERVGALRRPNRDLASELTRIHDVLAKLQGKSAAELGCKLSSDSAVEAVFLKAKSLKGGDALACAREALRPVVEAQSLYATALYLSGDAKAALREHERVLEVSPAEEESLYGYAGTLWDSKPDDAALKGARAVLALELAWNPQGLHASGAKKLAAHLKTVADAGGPAAYRAHHLAPAAVAGAGTASGPGMPAPLSKDVVEAVQNTEMTPEMVKGLEGLVGTAEEHLAHQRYQDALDAYKRVIPFQPNNGRARAGMAWALVGLNRQPMAERIWSVAVQSDAAAVDHLGDALAQKGDRAGAVTLWKKLVASAPAYAASSGLQKKAQ